MNAKSNKPENEKDKKTEKYEKPILVKYSKRKRMTAVAGASGPSTL